MNKITFFNNDDSFVEQFKNIEGFEIAFADIREMESKANISKDNPLYEDYLRLLYSKENPGLNIFTKLYRRKFSVSRINKTKRFKM